MFLYTGCTQLQTDLKSSYDLCNKLFLLKKISLSKENQSLNNNNNKLRSIKYVLYYYHRSSHKPAFSFAKTKKLGTTSPLG
jgi:hypothetical protein